MIVHEAEEVARARWGRAEADYREMRGQLTLIITYAAIAGFCVAAMVEHVRRFRDAAQGRRKYPN